MPISWDEAVATIAERWRAIIASDGAEAILPFSYAGSMGQVQYYAGHPFFHALGASQLDRSICVTTALRGLAGDRGRRHRQRLRADGRAPTWSCSGA